MRLFPPEERDGNAADELVLPAAPVDPPRIETLAGGPAIRFSSLMASMAVHFSIVVGAPALLIFLTPIPELVPVQILRYEPIRIRLPEKMFLAQAAPRARAPRARAPQRRGPASVSAPGAGLTRELARSFYAAPASMPAPPALGEIAQPAAPPSRRRIELPPMRPQPKAEVTLLQPDFPEAMPIKPNVPTPQLLLWSAAPKARRPLKEFVMPGAHEPKQEIRVLDAPPELKRPVATTAADLRFAPATEIPNPKLPAPPAPTAPLRKFTPPPDRRPTQVSSLDPFAGEPLAIVSLPDRPQPFPEVLSIPAGSQLSRVSAPGDGLADSKSNGPGQSAAASSAASQSRGRPGSPAGSSAGAGIGVAGAAGSAESAARIGAAGGEGVASSRQPASNGGGSVTVARAGAGGGPGAGIGSGSAALGAGAGSANSGSFGSGGPGTAGSGAGGLGAGGNGAGVLAGRAGPPIRVEHPVNDVFDVVVVGSSTNMPQTAGILSASPVYTVFLKVGTPKSWIMQYCAFDRKKAPLQTGSVVQLSKPAAVKAPFPRITVVPPLPLLPAKDSITIHGYVSAEGAFQELRVLAGHQAAQSADLLNLLEHWQFRPSTRDGGPVAVEMVLVIPPQSP